jgi:hypothetical protein
MSPTASGRDAGPRITTASRRSSTNSPALSGAQSTSPWSIQTAGRGRMGRWSTARPKDFPVERMTRRCAAPKITHIQRRFASSRFAADTALLIMGSATTAESSLSLRGPGDPNRES